MPETITFTQSMLDAFAQCSGDVNPLHTDAMYAQSTPFGEPVVFGMLGVVAGLGQVLRQMPIELTDIEVRFVQPMFLQTPYNVDLEAEGRGRFRVRLHNRGVDKLVFSFGYSTSNTAREGVTEPAGAPRSSARNAAITQLACQKAEGRYASGDVQQLGRLFDFDASRLPECQWTSLLWASYLVGMELPGQQALFVSCKAQFDARSHDNAAEYTAQVDALVQDAGLLEIAGQLQFPGGKVSMAIEALCRPPPVAAQTASELFAVPHLAGKHVVITGASRGLGAVLARIAGRSGANVALHYRDNEVAAETVAADIEANGGSVVLIRGDLREGTLFDEIVAEATSNFGPVDCYVGNAYPPIRPMRPAELADAYLEQWLALTVQASVRGIQRMLPALANGGLVVNVSSLYVELPQPNFSHYVLAKSAIDGYICALAAELPTLNFINVRPPKFLSDQTNVNVDLTPACDTDALAQELWEVCFDPSIWEGNYAEWSDWGCLDGP